MHVNILSMKLRNIINILPYYSTHRTTLFAYQVKEIASSSVNVVDIEDGTACPVCLDDMKKKDRVVACSTCRNLVHEDCFLRWKRSKGRRTVSCVVCRARWKDKTDQQKYLNLSAYVSDHEAIDNNLFNG